MTKDAIRQKVWTRIEAAGAARFPGAHARIPNFAHAEKAAGLLSELTIWKRANVIKVGASAPLLAVRRAALEENKIVYLAVPGLGTERCFLELDPSKLGVRTASAANVRGALQVGRAVTPQEMRSVDLVVVGSVAVTKQGARLGKGSGSEDLEYGLLRHAGKTREYTPIITLVHPLQVVNDRIPMRAHDIPIDFLSTPDHVVAAPSLYQRPRGIMWDLLPENRIRAIPVLRKGRPKRHRAPAPRHV